MFDAKKAVGSIYVQDVNSISEIFNGNRSYAKGSIVLHMLRGVIGDSVFFRIIKKYMEDPQFAYGVAVPMIFKNCRRCFGNSLDYFFQEWIYGESYPHYYLKWNYTEQTDNLYKIDLYIDQANNTYPLFFIMPVQIKISTTIKDTIITFFNNQPSQSFNFYVEGEPTNFIFDPHNFILEDSFIEDPHNLEIPQNFNLLQNYPNPFNNTTTIRFQSSKREKVIIKIFNLLGDEIAAIFNDEVEAGEYEVNFNASSLGSGVYFFRMFAGDFMKTKKLVLLK